MRLITYKYYTPLIRLRVIGYPLEIEKLFKLFKKYQFEYQHHNDTFPILSFMNEIHFDQYDRVVQKRLNKISMKIDLSSDYHYGRALFYMFSDWLMDNREYLDRNHWEYLR